MKLGCCTTIDHYQDVVSAGFDYIELPGNALATIPEETFAEWRRVIAAGTLPCPALNAAIAPEIKICGPHFSAPQAKDYLERLCRRAAQLGVKRIGIGSPKSREVPEGFSVEEAWRQAETFLTIAYEAAKPYGIGMLWEPLNLSETSFGVDTLESLAHVRALNAAGVQIGMVGDLYHTAYKGEGPDVLRQALDMIGHVHIASVKDGHRGYPIDADAAVMLPLLAVCREKPELQLLSAEVFSGEIGTDGKAYLARVRAWLETEV